MNDLETLQKGLDNGISDKEAKLAKYDEVTCKEQATLAELETNKMFVQDQIAQLEEENLKLQ